MLLVTLVLLSGCQNKTFEDVPVDSKGQPYVQGDMALIEIDGCGV